MSELLKIKEVADMVGCQVGVIYSMIRKGELSSVRIGKSWRVRRRDAEQIPPNPRATRTPYFLVVDDNAAGQEILRMMLKDLGMNRVLVGNLEDAMAELRRRRFAAVFIKYELREAFKIIKFARSVDPNYQVVLIRDDAGNVFDDLLDYGPLTVVKTLV